MALELWQQLGHASFKEWRCASEKARRDAKRGTRRPPHARKAVWKVPQQMGQSRLPPCPAALDAAAKEAGGSQLGAGGSQMGAVLSGHLHEEVLATPRGRREHKFKHTSPGGTVCFDEYASPAGLHNYDIREW